MEYFAFFALSLLLLGGLGYLVIEGASWLMDWIKGRREQRIARIEAELDRTAQQMRATILLLAEQLGADGFEARKALIRESFLASGQVPPPQ